MQDKMDANREAGREERKQEIRAGQEQMASLVSWMDARHERMMTCRGRRMATDLEANLEEKESGAVYREVPKEHAAVETGRAPKKRQ
jgi:hypothetical protein